MQTSAASGKETPKKATYPNCVTWSNSQSTWSINEVMEATCVQLRRLRDKKRHAPPRHTEGCCAGSHADAAVAMPE